MCAILDTDVTPGLFSNNCPEAGKKFLDWINQGKGKLVTGGQNLDELERSSAREWTKQGILSGMIVSEDKNAVRNRTNELRQNGVCESNDQHVIALAQVSGARLLYCRDDALRQDFKNKELVDQPRGKVYSTEENPKFLDGHKRLLGRKDLCRR